MGESPWDKQETGEWSSPGKHNCVCPGINLINLSTSKHKCTILLLDWSWLEQSHPENLFPALLSRTGWCSCASRDVPGSHICSPPLTGITCSPDTCGAAVMLGMLGTSGGIWDWVNLIILLLIGFKIHLEIGRRCFVPITTDGSQPAEVCLAGVGVKSWARVGLASRHWAKGREIEITAFKAADSALDGWSPRSVRSGAMALWVRKACGIEKKCEKYLSPLLVSRLDLSQ